MLLMADCATIEDIRRAVDMGFDLVPPRFSWCCRLDCTMADGPDLPLCVRRPRNSPVFPSSARAACTRRGGPRRDDAGAWAVVVGTAITHPTSITSWFKAALEA
ncbi:MAG: hypothetical protein ACLS89_00010 [Collinsella sp.]